MIEWQNKSCVLELTSLSQMVIGQCLTKLCEICFKKRSCQVDFKGNGISIKIQHNKIWKKVFKERSVECVGILIQFNSTTVGLIQSFQKTEPLISRPFLDENLIWVDLVKPISEATSPTCQGHVLIESRAVFCLMQIAEFAIN